MHLVISMVVCLVMMTSLGSCADCSGPSSLTWQFGSGPVFSKMSSKSGFMGRGFGRGFMGRGFGRAFRRGGGRRFGSFGAGSVLDVDGLLSQMDTNNDNKISSTEDRNNLFDTSKDGKITRGEFVSRMFNELCYPKMLATYLFDEIDANQDGVITTDGDLLSSNFDANGEADVSPFRQQLQQADRNVHKEDRTYLRLFKMIKKKYDGQ